MNLTTPTHKLFIARPEDDENGASGAPAVFVNETAGDFANKPDGTVDVLDPAYLNPVTEISKGQVLTSKSKVNGIVLSFSGGSAADKTFTYDIFTWANENGAAKHTVNGTGILGTQQVVKFPHNGVAAPGKFWADTLVVTWENHPKEVESTDIIGHNSIAEVWLDMTALRYLFIQISDSDGSTGTEAGDIACYFRYF